MATSVNKRVDGADRLIKYQMRDQIWSLTIGDKTDLIDLDIGPGNDVTVTPHSDYRKENVIDASAVGTGASLTITHGTNDTDGHSKLVLDVSGLNSTITALAARVEALENK